MDERTAATKGITPFVPAWTSPPISVIVMREMSNAAAVVIGDHSQGLAVVRSAGETGASVWVVNDSALALSRFSRYLSGYTRLQRRTLHQLDEQRAANALLSVLLDLPVRYPAVLFGVDEDITRFIHLHRDSLKSKYFVPDVPLGLIYDKYVFNATLPEDVRTDTRLATEIDAVAGLHSDGHILKGRNGNAFRRITGRKALRLSDLTERERAALFTKIAPDQVIVQEVIQSDLPVVSICSFSVNGQIAGLFAYEKLRQYPDQFGTGTYLRSTRMPVLERVAETIIGIFNYTGISEIEFVRDRRNNRHRVIEMNPRTWKSVYFATKCGQNLVAKYLQFVGTGETSVDGDYASDRYWVDLATDIPQMFREKRVFRYARGLYECTWERSDPAPALALWTLFPLIAVEEHLAR
jgi:predicted ATP-grasp superfamily ATP-dependent carboligase